MKLLDKALVFILTLSAVILGNATYDRIPEFSFYLRQILPSKQPAPVAEVPAVPEPAPVVVEAVPPPKPAPVPAVVSEQPLPEEPKPDPNEKVWLSGNHYEWRIPEGKYKIILKYKEPNGRLILDYEFKVNPKERVEIQAIGQ